MILATSLAHSDVMLMVLYAVSMYLSVRFGSMPATDPQQAPDATHDVVHLAADARLLRLEVPLAVGDGAVLALVQRSSRWRRQFYMLRRYHEPLSFVDSEHVVTEAVPETNGRRQGASGLASSNGAANRSGNRSGSRRKRNKKGA